MIQILFMRVTKITLLFLLLSYLLAASSFPATESVTVAQTSNPASGYMEHQWNVEIVLVNYNTDLIMESVLLNDLPTTRDYTTVTTHIHYEINYHITYADESFTEQLRQVMLENSVNGTGTGSRLNTTALEYQKAHPDEPQKIFYPRDGLSIDGYAVEDWLLENPPVQPPELGYTLYLLNFSEFDTPDHSWEHWYDYHPVDPDSGRAQDFFRLEWDNRLNEGVAFEFPAFGGRGNIYVIDPTADQWYLTWARIWWESAPYEDSPLYSFYDLDGYIQTLNLTQSEDVFLLNAYLNQYISDPIIYLFFPGQHDPAAYVQSGSLTSLVFAMDVASGISVDSLRWVTNAALQLAHLEELLPFITWNVDVQFLDIDNHPAWKQLFWNYATLENGVTKVDGAGMFNAIYETMRPQYISDSSNSVDVFGVVFIKKNMFMYYGGRTFTGLGGSGQTVIWKSWERYYLSDGVTPKSGVSVIQLHETMHAIGFGHTWSTHHYAGDFSISPMGYFSFHNGTATFDRNWAQSTFLDQMFVDVATELQDKWESYQTMGLSTVEYAYRQASAMIDLAFRHFNKMDWLGCYQALKSAKDWIKRMDYAVIDTTPPTIVDWGIEPDPFEYNDFTVWATIEDDIAGVENVTVTIEIDDTLAVYQCTQEGGNWTAHIPQIPNTAETVRILINATDRGLNSAFVEKVFYASYPLPMPLTPIVIVGIIGIVILIGHLWKKR